MCVYGSEKDEDTVIKHRWYKTTYIERIQNHFTMDGDDYKLSFRRWSNPKNRKQKELYNAMKKDLYTYEIKTLKKIIVYFKCLQVYVFNNAGTFFVSNKNCQLNILQKHAQRKTNLQIVFFWKLPERTSLYTNDYIYTASADIYKDKIHTASAEKHKWLDLYS
jgi:hypothetical protein